MGSMLGLPEYMRRLSSYDHILRGLSVRVYDYEIEVEYTSYAALDVWLRCTEFRFSSCASL